MFIDIAVKKCDEKLVETARMLGYTIIACEEFSSEKVGINIARKKTLTPGNLDKLKKSLKELPGSTIVISVVPRDTASARWGAHDSRIDSLVMSLDNVEVFDKKQFSVMKYYGKPLEIWLSDLREADETTLAKVYRRVNLALRRKIPIIVGSGATKWSELAHPRSLTALLSLLLDFPEAEAILALTNHPYLIVSRKVRRFG